ncbi:glycosyltransferase, partial [Candidatus Woesearchaeota archaeon]|nr:glycosyltransferase [Candidatus Woesearchaeota archaeon]
MNILTLANINSKKYGSFEKYLVDFSHFMKKKGHRHYILVIKEPVTPVKEKLIEAGAEIYIKYLDSLRLKNSIFLLDFIKKNKINVVHSHFYNLYNFFSFLIYFTKAKYFITYHISGEDEIRNSGFREKIKKIRQNIFGMGINKIFCVSNYNQKK